MFYNIYLFILFIFIYLSVILSNFSVALRKVLNVKAKKNKKK